MGTGDECKWFSVIINSSNATTFQAHQQATEEEIKSKQERAGRAKLEKEIKELQKVGRLPNHPEEDRLQGRPNVFDGGQN